jgi:hypothetical protein
MSNPGAEVGRYLEITTSSANRLAAPEEAADLKKYLKMLQNLRPVPLRGTEKGFVAVQENRNYST